MYVFEKVFGATERSGSVLIALLICGVFVYAFAFDGFNVETATGGEVEAWLAAAGGGVLAEAVVIIHPPVHA